MKNKTLMNHELKSNVYFQTSKYDRLDNAVEVFSYRVNRIMLLLQSTMWLETCLTLYSQYDPALLALWE